jgi:hypothetical protein
MQRLSTCLFLSAIFSAPASAALNLPERLEHAQFTQAEKLMQEVVHRYERARINYTQKGPQAFVNALSDKISYEHKKELMQMLSKLPELPTLSMTNKTITFSLEDEKPLSFDVYEVVLGKFKSGKFNKAYNFNSSPKENLEVFQLKDKEQEYMGAHFLDRFDFIFLPRAQAQSKTKAYYPGIAATGSLIGVTVLPSLFRIYPDDYNAGGGHNQ